MERGGQGGREESRRESAGGGTELLQSCRLRSSSFLNSPAPKKVSAQQIADEITPRLSLFPGSCQTPVGQFCPPATGQAWKRRNLQTFLGNFCYGERILTFESYTWAGLGSRSSLQLQLDRDPGDEHSSQMLNDLHVSTPICCHI